MPLDRQVVETLAFFTPFGVGRTESELAALHGRRGLAAALERLVRTGRTAQRGPEYTLSGTTLRVDPERRRINDRKLGEARERARALTDTPFVRLIALGNSVAFGTATELSDFDCFVVTAPNRLWTARFFLLMRAKWRGLAKRSGATADRFDFGWWIDETAMDLSRGAIPDDVHLKFWLAYLVPLVDRGGWFERLVATNRSVLGSIQARSKKREVRRTTTRSIHEVIERLLGGWFGDVGESLLFWIQRAKILVHPLAERSSADVVVTRHECKLHHVDERSTLRDQCRAVVTAAVNGNDPASRGRKRREATGSQAAGGGSGGWWLGGGSAGRSK